MAECPFCKAPIPDSLIRDGGRCPRCFIEIPGEESPTNPGVDLQAPESPPSRSRFAAIAGILTILVVAGALAAWKVHMDRLSEAAAAADALPSFYLEPLGEVPPQAPQDDLTAETRSLGNRPAPSRPSGSDAADTTSSGARASPTRFDFTDDEADARFAGLAEPAGPRDLDLGIPVDPDGSVRLRSPGTTSGVLTDPDEIHAAVARSIQTYHGQLAQCYTQRLKSAAGLKGAWNLTFMILPDGATSDVQCMPQGPGDAELETCVVRRASTWKFSPMIQAQRFELPFRFGS
ncbi:MAG: AgmX/PglI C-terminal domain-containing protein [Deltaproteobacteria bacterium]|nr:AgmX/PglI C-terminal domain-containing protein [Deltaproteobacteria bacterium]